MSHSSGTVLRKSDNSLLGHFEYNGTTDVALPRIFDSVDALADNWRAHGFEAQCSCTDGLVDVRIEADYGGGIEWDGQACERHMCIAVGHTTPAHYRDGGD